MKSQWLFYWLAVPLFCLVMAGSTSAGIILDWVDVGDPGNPQNTVRKRDGTSGYGAVAYSFRIGKFETTNFQYVQFLNAVAATDMYELYDPSMSGQLWGGIRRTGTNGNYAYSVKPNMGDKPVNYVSWYDAARFANWLHNGQPVGLQDASTTEDGAYTFSGFETVGLRNTSSRFFVPNEHEWEKAAFYEPDAVTSVETGWWKRSTHSDVFPSVAFADATGDVINPGLNVVNFRHASNWNGSGSIGNVTTVGSAGNETYYGAKDMAGNVFEWVTADPTKPDPNGWGPYTVRGGSFINIGHVDIWERNLVHHDDINHAVVDRTVGFRIAAMASPFTADFDTDFDVDSDDLAAWNLAFGIMENSDIDTDADGDSDGADFLAWQKQFTGGLSPISVGTLVPEPNANVLLSGLLAMMLFIRHGYFQGSTVAM